MVKNTDPRSASSRYHGIVAWLVLVLLMWASIAGAQAPKRRSTSAPKPSQDQKAEAPRAWPIHALSVDGNRTYSDQQVLAVAGLRTGQVAGEREFEAARDRLVASGVFESVGYRFEPAPGGEGYAATFQVVEVTPVFPLRFEDLPGPTEIDAWLRSQYPLYGPRIAATQPILQRYAQSIQEFLAKRGFKDKVIGKVVADAPDRLAVVFRPATPPAVVAEVKFKNNSVVPQETLQNAIAGVAIGLPYQEERFRQLLEANIRPLYEMRGRIRVAFPAIQVEQAKDVKGLAITVEVNEGEVFKLGEVRLEGAESADLLKAGGFKEGENANFDEIRAGTERIRHALQRNGYMNAKVGIERSVDDQKKVVDLTIRIEPNPRFTFGRLEIRGLDLHSEPAVRKLWGLKPGAPFNVEYPDYFLSRIREDGVFDNLGKTTSTIQVNDEARTVDVTLTFAGAGEGQKKKKAP
jgi:outer membrane protein insertion porin family